MFYRKHRLRVLPETRTESTFWSRDGSQGADGARNDSIWSQHGEQSSDRARQSGLVWGVCRNIHARFGNLPSRSHSQRPHRKLQLSTLLENKALNDD